MLTPTFEQFEALTRTANLIPVYREILADRLTPVSAYERIRAEGPSFLLESVEGGERLARYSFLGSRPFMRFTSRDGLYSIASRDGERTEPLAVGEDPLHPLKRLLARYRFASLPGLPRFCGGAVGFLAYDIVRHFERLPTLAVDDLHLPDCHLLFTDSLVVFDHVRHRMLVVSLAHVESDARSAYDRAVSRIEELVALLRTPVAEPSNAPMAVPLRMEHNMRQEDYESAVRRCKEYIAAGDAFQVVPSLRFALSGVPPSWQIYRALRSINPSPYMYFLDLGDCQIAGSSPEILVTLERGRVRVRPIAGTRPRGATPEEDAALEAELLADEKERAEHIMLVDLGRNDVGRVSRYGSVRVDDLMVVERYSHVMHLVSNVTGELADGCDSFDVARAAFPAGTLSGAPKVRAMQIIEELEPTRRGLYGGAVGYFSFTGDLDLAIAIRTMLIKGETGYIQAGAGVVADSEPEREYQECVNKARALLSAVEMARAGLD
jgi:anthranilate synthase component 1